MRGLLFSGLMLLLHVFSSQALSNAFLEMGSPTKFAENVIKVLHNDDMPISSPCKEHFSKYVKSLLSGEMWALKVFDSNSRFPSGILNGHLTDLGSFDECISVVEPIDASENILGKYCIATIPIDLRYLQTQEQLLERLKNVSNASIANKQGISLATCTPHTCSANDTRKIYSAIGLEMNFHEQTCQTKESQYKLDGKAYMAIAFFSVFIGIMVVSTVYDVILYYLEKEPPYTLLIAFSVLTNVRSLITLSKSPYQISCLHGIRVFTTMWIIYSHTTRSQSAAPATNYFYDVNWHKNQANMYLLNVGIGVDTFFLIGGLLVSYNYLYAAKKEIKFNIVVHYLHRYLRLTPVVIAVVVFAVGLFRSMASGPLAPLTINHSQAVCEKYWWKALLHIQNFYNDVSDMCDPPSWYISMDFQLYLLSPFILIPLRRWPTPTLICTGILAACSAVSGFVVSWIYELGIVRQANRTPEQITQYLSHYYYMTPVRAAPWFIGIVVGYAIFKFKQSQEKPVINKVAVLTLWLISMATLCMCAFGAHSLVVEYNKIASCLYMSLVKPAWAIALSWIIFACLNGYGGPVNWFLSLPLFEVLSKLTYSLYMVHFFVLMITRAWIREATTHGDFQVMYAFWGDFVFTLAASVFCTLAFELPMLTIEKLLFHKKAEKRLGSPLITNQNENHLAEEPQYPLENMKP